MGMTYIIKDQVLFGSVGGQHFRMRAVSGGRAGSKEAGAVDRSVANNPYKTGQKQNTSKGIVGGPLPCGNYRMAVDATKTSKWIRLIPGSSNVMAGRDSFAIHGRGRIGSNGCIVVPQYSELVKLWDAVKRTSGATLRVMAGDLTSALA